ncbi:3-ketoacyl-CoA synthase 11 [Senna tora]|uniref:3-ketoacyl-CoA synthase 11 n=1 Tax=Senna tora TaxID=362788 RepID=A0A834WW40_9FABA|nr:3-ketoacyl-CoA synthase 11 [Senna tora]
MRNNPKKEVYLVDFSCYKPHHSRLFTTQVLIERAESSGHLSEENMNFIRKVVERSGLGPKTCVPESLTNIPPNTCLKEAWKEMEAVLFGAIDEVLEKTRIDAKEIGILIVNRYKLRDDVLSYNLSGMGCSAGLLAVDFAQRLLQHRCGLDSGQRMVVWQGKLKEACINASFGSHRLKPVGGRRHRLRYVASARSGDVVRSFGNYCCGMGGIMVDKGDFEAAIGGSSSGSRQTETSTNGHNIVRLRGNYGHDTCRNDGGGDTEARRRSRCGCIDGTTIVMQGVVMQEEDNKEAGVTGDDFAGVFREATDEISCALTRKAWW